MAGVAAVPELERTLVAESTVATPVQNHVGTVIEANLTFLTLRRVAQFFRFPFLQTDRGDYPGNHTVYSLMGSDEALIGMSHLLESLCVDVVLGLELDHHANCLRWK